jgi:hypothetical protein
MDPNLDATNGGEIAVALGAGGARGLAHVLVVEAFDELGVKPAAIAGASMGAVVGAAWAAGWVSPAVQRPSGLPGSAASGSGRSHLRRRRPSPPSPLSFCYRRRHC